MGSDRAAKKLVDAPVCTFAVDDRALAEGDPSALDDQARPRTPELELVGAVLRAAVDDWHRGDAAARDWFASDELVGTHGRFTFRSVCDWLGLEPGVVRAAVAGCAWHPRGGRMAGAGTVRPIAAAA